MGAADFDPDTYEGRAVKASMFSMPMARVIEEPLSLNDWLRGIGESGLQEMGGLILHDPNPSWDPYSARGLMYSHGILKEMLYTDPVIRGGDRAVRSTIQQAHIQAVPAGGADNPTDLERRVADWYDYTLQNIRGGIPGLLESASNYVSWGFWMAEPVLAFRDTPFGYKLCLDRLEPRLPWSISKWIFHEEGPNAGDLAGVEQIGDWRGSNTRIIPMEKLVLWVNDYDSAGPEGYPILRSVYFAWHQKREIQIADAGVWERWKYGVLMAGQTTDRELKPTDPVLNALETTLKNYFTKATGYLIRPTGFEIDVLFPAHEAPDPTSRIQAYDKQILQAYAAMFLIHGTTDTGTRNVTAEHITMFRASVENYVRHITETLCTPGRPGTGLLPRLARMNFPIPIDFRWPTLEISGIQYRDVAAILNALGLLAQSQFFDFTPPLQKWVMSVIGAPIGVKPYALVQEDVETEEQIGTGEQASGAAVEAMP